MEDNKKENTSEDFSQKALIIYLGLSLLLWIIFSFAFAPFNHFTVILFSFLAAFALTSVLITIIWFIIEIIWAILGLNSNKNSQFILLVRQVCLMAFFALLISGGVCFAVVFIM
jgi:hypothetical protein